MDILNVDILDVDKTIDQELNKPVTSTLSKVMGGDEFDPEGLFSEEIFGEMYEDVRMIKFGYIDLNTQVIHPKIYKNLMRLKRAYGGILKGSDFAYFDKKESEFVMCKEDHPDADTGYSFFRRHFKDIKFKTSDSATRKDKIKLMNKYKSRDALLFDKAMVMPAGLRDYRESENGQVEVEEINKFYQSIMNYAKAIPNGQQDNPIYNSIFYAIQLKVNAIFDYVKDIIDGKKGWLQKRYADRNLHLGTRNVISAARMSSAEIGDPQSIKPDETKVPLFQCMKSLQPAVVYQVRNFFVGTIFDTASDSIPVIDPKTQELTYVRISEEEKDKWLTADGINRMIDRYRNPNNRSKPVSIKGLDGKFYHLYLVRDVGDEITIIRDLNQFKFSMSQWNSKEITIETIGEKYSDIPGGPIKPMSDILSDDDFFTQVATHLNAHTDTQIDNDNRHLAEFGITTEERIKDLLELKKKENTYNKDEYRPLTYKEMFYIATYYASKKAHTLITRYPVLTAFSIYSSKIHLISTTKSRKVVHRISINSDIREPMPEYPIMGMDDIDSTIINIVRYPLLNAKQVGTYYREVV